MNSENAPFFVDNEVIVLTKNGIWLADGHEISHEPTRKLFARSLVRESEGYFLKIGRESKKIRIEDTAYFVLRLNGSAQSGYRTLLNDETEEELKPETLKYKPGRLTCLIKKGTEEAKFLHAPYFDLLKELKENPKQYFLEIQGQSFVLSQK